MRSILESTCAFEAWMRKRTDVSGKLLKSKHRKMGAGAFPFLRATFYRWVEQWPEVCPRLAGRDAERESARRLRKREARGDDTGGLQESAAIHFSSRRVVAGSRRRGIRLVRTMAVRQLRSLPRLHISSE